MYGKKRIIFQKNNQIVLAGSDGQGGSFIPVGILLSNIDKDKYKGKFVAEVLNDKWDNPRDPKTKTKLISADSQKELKDLINNKYKWIKNKNKTKLPNKRFRR
tara:strand:+ start:300 stop:608 length:309 start_codon:yes stop_codon:yes gene_type:complete